MGAVVGGLLAALLWAGSSLGFANAARRIASGSVIAWTMTIGLVLDVVAILVTRAPAPTGQSNWLWLSAAGVANVLGIGCFVQAVKRGRIGVLAPIASTEGAIAAVLGVAFGERLRFILVILLAVIVVGVVVTAAGERGDTPGANRTWPAVWFAVGAAVGNGASIFMVGHVTSGVPAVWAVLPARVVGVLLVAAPTAAAGRLRLPRAAVPAVLVTGFCDLAGFVAYAAGASSSVAVAAVLASMFAAFAVAGAYVLHGERLVRIQLAGISLIVIGVAVLTGLTAHG